MEDKELKKLRNLILQRPQSKHLLNNKSLSERLQEFSQLPDMPERETWWPQIRSAIGFVMFMVQDLYLTDVEFRTKTNELLGLLTKKSETDTELETLPEMPPPGGELHYVTSPWSTFEEQDQEQKGTELDRQ